MSVLSSKFNAATLIYREREVAFQFDDKED